MKDYKEMADSVYMTVQQENIRKAKRAMVIRRTVSGCCALAGVFGVVIAVGGMGKNVDLTSDNVLAPGAAPEETEETETKFQYIFQSFTSDGKPAEISGSSITIGTSETAEDSGEAETAPEETVQIGWIVDENGNTYPATVPADQQPSDAELISQGITPSDTDKILAALNHCFDEKTEGITDYENVRVVTFAPEKYHNVYVKCGMGEKIYALEDGKVICADWRGGNGHCVMVINDKGNVISYCHLNSMTVKEGDSVTAGQMVGFAGNSGMASHIGAKYIISSFEDALSIYTHNVGYSWASFSANVPANSGISTKETKTIYDALIEGNSKNTEINPDRLEMNVTLDNGIEVRIYGFDDAALLLNTEEEEKVYALTGGEIVGRGTYGENGCCIDVLTDDGKYLTYCHLGEIDEEIEKMIEGDYCRNHRGMARIEEGQLLGTAGKFDGEDEATVLYAIRLK